ncbi:MAG: YqgE/AlgH family protein [Pelagimonas sp.]|nr:YqgE/AlgH family protein [Pelagimonas sp.]
MLPTTKAGTTNLTGRMLIAMPGMGDPRFDHSVVFLCDHSDEGAMGLIINKPSKDVDMPGLLSQLSIEPVADLSQCAVYFGGPVEMGRGFVLHSGDYASAMTTVQVLEGIHMTATLDILEELGRGEGPSKWMMALGYAGWGAGQLESELAQNAWLVCDGAAELVFDLPDEGKWEAALETLGVAALALSSEGGRA